MENFSKIGDIFEASSGSLTIPFSFQLEAGHLNKLTCLFAKPNNINEISITGQNLDAPKLKILYNILEAKTNIKRLILSNNKIKDPEGIEYLCVGIKNTQIEYLDLSNNRISDNAMDFIVDLIENSSLVSLNLDNNLITKGNLPAVLCKNDKIQYFSISFNPLSYEFVSDLLNGLILNKSLKTLNIKGLKLEGPAPIKENSSGHLTKKEAVIIKLAYVLRFSHLTVLSIDIDSNSLVQLEELEKTLVKYNSKLISLNSEGLDWKSVPYNTPLLGISRALKANLWLSKNSSLPKERQSDPSSDIEELVYLKLQGTKSDQTESFFSNAEALDLPESSKKYQKKNISAFCSIGSSPKSPDNPKRIQRICNFPLVFSAETPQFTTSIKGMTFSPDKIADIGDISSIDFEEKRCTPIKMKQEKHLEEMWNRLKNMEKSFNSQLEMQAYKISVVEERTDIALKTAVEGAEGRATERNKHEEIDKGVWPALSRIEKFMSMTGKKEKIMEKRLEDMEDEVKTQKESFKKLLGMMEEQKSYLQESIKDKPTKIDLEIMEKNLLKLAHKVNFITSEMEGFHKDLGRLQNPNKQIEALSQEIGKLKDREAAKYLEVYKTIENFTKDLQNKHLALENKLLNGIKVEKTPEREYTRQTPERFYCDISPINKTPVPPLDIPRALHNSSVTIGEIRRKMTTERNKSPISQEGFLPGEAESLVMSAIMDKANISRRGVLCKSSNVQRSNTPLLGFKSKLKDLEPENIPSAHLQETLRQRGIPYDPKSALTERKK
ncbi:hypothetical protein SteCoe_28130 [Stentor coeruleus]|uniref:Leucine-rich repeat-containing protein n=1 Tax=Stentor coeruleus TaxID=5963 RepID=A0A1R2B8X1_9CILI|nr:hypothetical protein SteCoe_28130 [Stentor coeruleus]